MSRAECLSNGSGKSDARGGQHWTAARLSRQRSARRVLVSLWNVDDKATRLLMERFYEYWLYSVNPVPKARALQLAQEAVRRRPGFSGPEY